MEWTYAITKPFSINRHSLHSQYLLVSQDLPYTVFNGASMFLSFNPGEIDEVLYSSLVKGYPDCVARRPKNDLLAAVYQARGLC